MISAINSLSVSDRPNSQKREGKPMAPNEQQSTTVTSKRKIIKHEAPNFNRSKILAKIQHREQEKQVKKAKQENKLSASSRPDNKALKIIPPKTKLLSKDPEQTKEQLRSVLNEGGFQFNEKERKVLSQILNKE